MLFPISNVACMLSPPYPLKRRSPPLQRAFSLASGCDRYFHMRRSIKEELSGQRGAKPDNPLFHVFCLPGHRLPRRIKDQVARIAKELDPVATRLDDIQEVCLADTVLTRSCLNLDAAFCQDIREIGQVLGIA